MIADDYDEIDRITDFVTEFAAKCGVAVKPEEVRAHLLDLLNRDLARAYRLSPDFDFEEFPGVTRLEDFDELYFLLTENGQKESRSPWGSMAVRRGR